MTKNETRLMKAFLHYMTDTKYLKILRSFHESALF
jgi:hypothetical protein